MQDKRAKEFLAKLAAGISPCLAGERPLLLVGFSGGRDSLALLAGLHELNKLAGAGKLPAFQLAAAHYHHNLRGQAADGDQNFCRAWCARRGIPFYTALAQGLAPGQPNLEQRARAARYAWLGEVRQKLLDEGYAPVWLVTAHHREDQAETVLLHLLRGAGGTGLCGMRGQSGCLLRPLLDTPRADIMAYLAARGLCWREDASNQSTDYTRNYLRREIMPRLKKINPQINSKLAQTARIQASAEDFLARVTQDKMRQAEVAAGVVKYPWAAFTAEPLALRRRLVRALWCAVKKQSVCPLEFARVEEVLRLSPGGTLHLAGGVAAGRRGKMLVMLEQPEDMLSRRRAQSRSGQNKPR